MFSNTDFLVIGSGVAGLFYALKAAEHGNVSVITKKSIKDSNTLYAQGGIASVFDLEDSFELHIRDTMEAGCGLTDKDAATLVVKNGPARIRELINLGVKFDTKPFSESENEAEFSLDLGLEGGHSRKRIVHALDMTGHELETVLSRRVKAHPGIKVFENHLALDFITDSNKGNGERFCNGVVALDSGTLEIRSFFSKVTVLAAGGSGSVYPYTSNPDIATGDGIAMGYRAGAGVANLEFMQFHPTCMCDRDGRCFLISEAVRGEGGILRDSSGNPFMHKYSSFKDLACRDIVARAIHSELKNGEKIFLDISFKKPEFVKKRFPNLYGKCLEMGFDMTKEPLPVVPAAHYMCGGIVTDCKGQTDLKWLYAIGEAACTGLHGANRLASNSLLEALVYAHEADLSAIAEASKRRGEDFSERIEQYERKSLAHADAGDAERIKNDIKDTMWNYAGIVRSDKGLREGLLAIQRLKKRANDLFDSSAINPHTAELRSIAEISELIMISASMRKESRGLHFNQDHPEKDDLMKKNTILKKIV